MRLAGGVEPVELAACEARLELLRRAFVERGEEVEHLKRQLKDLGVDVKNAAGR